MNCFFLGKTIINFMKTDAEYNNKSSCNTPRKVFPIQTKSFENLEILGEEWWCCLNPVLTNRYFSHMTKSRIFKSLNLRRKADRSFCNNLLEKHFRHLKLYSNPQLTGLKSLSYGYFLKDKRLMKSTFLRGPAFQVLLRGSSP